MRIRGFLIVQCFYSVFLRNIVLGQDYDVIPRNPAVPNDGKVTVNFDDLVIEVTPPRGRENILSKDIVYQQWKNVDDVTYWESIYGSMDDIPAFEDLPEIPGETFELKCVELDDEDLAEENSMIFSKNHPDYSGTKNADFYDNKKDPAVETIDTNDGNLFPDRCEWKNPLYSVQKSPRRQKRETSGSKRRQSESNKKSNSESKRKSRTLSLLQGGLGSRQRSSLRSDYLFNKYGRRHYRPYKFEGDFTPIDDCSDDDDIVELTKSKDSVGSTINVGADELLNLGSRLANQGQTVVETISNVARQLVQAKHDVIDLGLRTAQAVSLGSLNNAATNCLEELVDAAPANIDTGLDVVGNSVLNTNSDIINADTDISVGVKASLEVEANADLRTVAETDINDDTDEGLVGANLEEVADCIEDAENEEETDLANAEVVGDSIIVPTEEIVEEIESPLDSESDIDINANVESGIEVVPDIENLGDEEIVDSGLQINAGSEIQTSLNDGISTNLKSDINVGGTINLGNVRNKFGSDISCECEDSSEQREFFREIYDDEREYRRRFPGSNRYRQIPRGYQRTLNSGIHADAGIHTSLDAGVDINSNLGSLRTGTEGSLDLDSNLDIGGTINSGIHADSGIRTSLDGGLDIDTNFGAGGLRAGAKSSLDLDSNMNLGLGSSRIRGEEYDRYSSRYRDGSNRDEEIWDDDDSEEYREYRRRFPSRRPYRRRYGDDYRALNSEINANAGIHTSLDAGVDINSNLGSLRAGSDASSNLDSNLDIGSDVTSGIQGNSGIRTSLDVGLDTNLDAGTSSSLDLKSSLDIESSRLKSNRGNYRAYGNCDSNENDDGESCEDSEEYREYRQRFPDDDRYWSGHRDFYRKQNSAINAGIHTSLDAGVDINTDLPTGGIPGINSGLHANTGIHGSLNAGVDLDSNLSAGHLHSNSRGSVDVHSRHDIGRTRSRLQNGNYRDYDYRWGDDYSSEDQDYDEEEEYRRYPGNRYRDHLRGYRGRNSGIHADSAIRTSLDAGLDINSNAAGGQRVGAKSATDLNSHIDIGATSRLNGVNPLYDSGVIDSGIRADAEILTSLDTDLDINPSDISHSGIKSSLDVDSRLDIGARTNIGSAVDGRSRIEVDDGRLNEEAAQKICDAACRRITNSREYTTCPNSRFDDAFGKRSEYLSREKMEQADWRLREGSPYMCENCRRQMYRRMGSPCPFCGNLGSSFEERRPFLTSGTIYHFDRPRRV